MPKSMRRLTARSRTLPPCCDIGVAWNETSEPQDDSEPMDYISVKLDGPEMNKPINAALFDREDGADLVWSRPKAQ